MRRALWRAVRGDVAHRKGSSLLLLLVVAVAAAGITAGLGQQRDAAERWDAAFAEANGAHVAVFGSPDALRAVAAEPAVAESSGPGRITLVSLGQQDGRRTDDVDARAAGPVRPAVGRPKLFGGRWLSGRDGEVVVERSLALDLGVEPGDRVTLDGQPFTVAGVALDLLDCFYPECDSATVWVPDQAMAALDPAGQGSLLLVRLHDPSAVGAFERDIQARYGTGVSHVLDWQDTRGDALVVNQFFAAFLASFGVFLLLAAGLVVLSSVSGRVLARYRELGMLKAVGFTPRSLTLLVLGENLTVALAGAVLGAVAGGFLAPLLQLRVAEVLERGGATFPAGVLLTAVAVVLVIVAAATLLPAWRAGRVPASRAIARGAGPVSTRPSRLARLAVRLHLGPPVAVGLKDATARRLRAGLAVATLAVTVVAVVVTLRFDRTVDALAANPALVGDPYDVAVDPGTVPPAEVEAALAAQPVASWFTATSRRGAVGDATFQVRALGGDMAAAGFAVQQGRMPANDGEAVAGYGLLHRLGLSVGDRLPLEVSGGRLDPRIVGWYSESEDSGEIVQLPLGALRRVEPGAGAGGYFARLRPGADPAAVKAALDRVWGGRAAVEVSGGLPDAFGAFRLAFYVITGLVLVVGLLNLVASTLLGIRERMRDIGILKTVGFTPRQLAGSVATGAGATALAAVLVGVPVGLLAGRVMVDGVGTGSGLGPGWGSSPAGLAVVAAGVALVALGAGLGALASWRAARARVVEVLRAE
ncbi:MAG TPA: FtsX-like permease family protein [Acidimicrobiales bacterium]|nr:FtsX-like permease family protein [Acidimicrobiales bacterium]